MQLVICIATLNLLLESLPPGAADHNWIRGIETGCVALFTIEFLLRLIACPLFNDEDQDPRMLIPQRQFWVQAFTWIDLLSILPFYYQEIVMPETGGGEGRVDGQNFMFVRMLRLVRLIRVLRMLKLGKYCQGIQLLGIAISRARLAFLWMLMLITMSVIFFASAVFYAEQAQATFDEANLEWVRHNESTLPDAGKPIQFQTVIGAMWWAIGTLTGSAYGDTYPHTPGGRMVAAFCMVAGLLVTAYPVTIITITFIDVWEQFKQVKELRRRRNRIIESYKSQEEIEQQKAATERARRKERDALRRRPSAGSGSGPVKWFRSAKASVLSQITERRKNSKDLTQSVTRKPDDPLRTSISSVAVMFPSDKPTVSRSQESGGRRVAKVGR